MCFWKTQINVRTALVQCICIYVFTLHTICLMCNILFVLILIWINKVLVDCVFVVISTVIVGVIDTTFINLVIYVCSSLVRVLKSILCVVFNSFVFIWFSCAANNDTDVGDDEEFLSLCMLCVFRCVKSHLISFLHVFGNIIIK